MIGGIALLAASIPRERAPRAATKHLHATERPWLTRDAQDQLIGPDGSLGPLFDSVTLGGPPPSPEARATIAQFAKANGVAIQLEVTDETLAAIRLTISFGGCCGYEAVDVLAMRLSRARTFPCCDCGGEWVDNWTFAPEPSVHVRAHVHVNTIELRWEPMLSTGDALGVLDGVVGSRVKRLARSAGDRLVELAPRSYRYEAPYDVTEYEYRPDWGMHLSTYLGVVAQASLDVTDDDVPALLRARWGRPRIEGSEWVWRRPERTVTAWVHDDHHASVTIDRTGESPIVAAD